MFLLRPLHRRRHHRGERGAVAVEAALVTPLLVVLVFGIIEFGFIFKDWLAVTSSVRAGARIASAEPRNTSFATDAAAQVAREGSALNMDDVEALWVYEASPDGFPAGTGSFDDCTTCVKFSWNEATQTFDPSAGSWEAIDHNACTDDTGHDSVGVYLAMEHDAITGLFFDSLGLSSHTVMSFEPIPTSQGCK
ncbi:MAG TPA: TadE/TadG family type IV pilus assembly protein [Nocardioidaceae bacterium]|nr:TadE/TadG family type IV pilus assembly protein [Nocardioidaceae bacterium]